MNRKKIEEYLKRVDELETKLTGEDKETYDWLIYGYHKCVKLLNEAEQQCKNQKEVINKAIKYIETCNPNVELHSEFLDESYLSNYGAKELLDILKEVSE